VVNPPTTSIEIREKTKVFDPVLEVLGTLDGEISSGGD
jgi:hypothetical protein